MPASMNKGVPTKGSTKVRKPSTKKRKSRMKMKPRKVNIGGWTVIGVTSTIMIAIVMLSHDRRGTDDCETRALWISM